MPHSWTHGTSLCEHHNLLDIGCYITQNNFFHTFRFRMVGSLVHTIQSDILCSFPCFCRIGHLSSCMGSVYHIFVHTKNWHMINILHWRRHMWNTIYYTPCKKDHKTPGNIRQGKFRLFAALRRLYVKLWTSQLSSVVCNRRRFCTFWLEILPAVAHKVLLSSKGDLNSR